MAKRRTTEEFIKESKAIFGNKFDYSETVYINNVTKLTLICKIHGRFEQFPNNHLRKHDCDKCAQEERIKKRSSNTEKFIKKAKKIWGNKFDYSKVVYKNNKTKVIIICKDHGEFKQTPTSHLAGHDCLECSKEDNAKRQICTTEEFISKVKTKPHAKNLDFSKTKYLNSNKDVIVSCKIEGHGDFKKKAKYLLLRGCPKCNRKKSSSTGPRYTTEQFVERAEALHGKKYDYSDSEYTGAGNKLKIICRRHGPFYQTPSGHLSKPNGRGCVECGRERVSKSRSKTTEYFIRQCKKAFGNLYTYEKSKYINAHKKVIITCRKHGDFKKSLVSVKHKHGCPECWKEEQDKKAGRGAHGWSYSYWEKRASKSPNFDSFKLYILKLKDINGKIFYKIGRTYTTVDSRFGDKSKLPYDFSILNIIEGEAREICELEDKLQAMCKEFLYKPKKEFGGMYECFSCIDPIEDLLKELDI